jgi:hypothetical protein
VAHGFQNGPEGEQRKHWSKAGTLVQGNWICIFPTAVIFKIIQEES